MAAPENPAVAQGFQTSDKGIVAAALVASKDGGRSVELATSENQQRLVGVVGDEALIELSDATTQVSVITSGAGYVLVSDINGQIEAGSKIAASPVAGVGMLATQSSTVVGVAQRSLSSVKVTKRTITAKDGNPQNITVGIVPVQVGVGSFVAAEEEGASYVPPFLQDFFNHVTGRDVPPVRVLLAALIFLLLFVSIVVLLYTSVRTSITSIGRNPLSEGAVRKSLGEVGIAIVSILIFSLITIYFVLTI